MKKKRVASERKGKSEATKEVTQQPQKRLIVSGDADFYKALKTKAGADDTTISALVKQ